MWSCRVEGGYDWVERVRDRDRKDCIGPVVDFPYMETAWDFFALHSTR